MQYAIVLVVIFLLWMTWRVHKHSQEVRFKNAMKAKLDKLLDGSKALSESIKGRNEDIRQLAKSIDKLAEEIRNDRKARHGK
jgi:low affinity Fe/Cu permease